MNRTAQFPELRDRQICADYLEGLIHVVPRHGAGDDAGKYCIGGFAIDLYVGLLQARQHEFPRWCWRSVFLPRHDKVSIHYVHSRAQCLLRVNTYYIGKCFMVGEAVQVSNGVSSDLGKHSDTPAS